VAGHEQDDDLEAADRRGGAEVLDVVAEVLVRVAPASEHAGVDRAPGLEPIQSTLFSILTPRAASRHKSLP
jgi:hypothetical protein